MKEPIPNSNLHPEATPATPETLAAGSVRLPEGVSPQPAPLRGPVGAGGTGVSEGINPADLLEVAEATTVFEGAGVSEPVMDPSVGAMTVWERVHAGQQALLDALAYHKISVAVTDLRQAAERRAR